MPQLEIKPCPTGLDDFKGDVNELVAAFAEECECHEVWFQAEDKGLGTFHQRMDLCAESEYLNRKAMAMWRGEEFTEEFKGVPRLIITTNGGGGAE